MILEELLRLRASDPRPTPAVHIRTKGYYNPASFTTPTGTSNNTSSGQRVSAGDTNTSPIISASLPKDGAQADGERSYYLDHRCVVGLCIHILGGLRVHFFAAGSDLSPCLMS